MTFTHQLLLTFLVSTGIYSSFAFADQNSANNQNSTEKSTQHTSNNESIEIGWEDLEAKGLDFEDPYEELTEEQMFKLALVVQFREAAKVVNKKDRNSKAFKRIEKDYQDAIQFLQLEKIDFEELIAKRDEITQKRLKRASTPNEEINGKRVRIPGYLLPLEFSEKKVTEFLLVPWVGACIHTPPPPPIQIVHVNSTEGIDLKDKIYAAVWVDGTIEIESSSRELDFVDGVENIEVGYKIGDGVVTPYSDK